MTKGCVDTMLTLQMLSISMAKFWYFVIFSLNFQKGMSQANCCIYYKCCFIPSLDKHYIRSVEIYLLWKAAPNIK